MVVKYLERYMEDDVPGGFVPGNLKELLEEAKEKTERPCLVLDASSAVSLFSDGLDLGCNGPLKSLGKRVRDFLEEIKSSGADVEVFYSGSRDTRNVAHWKERRLSKIKDIERFFDGIKTGSNAKIEHVQLAAAQSVVKNVFLSSESCRVRTSAGDSIFEVVELCRNREGVVVVAQDSDYLIFPEIRVYVSMKSVDLKTLDCKLYDRNNLLGHLRIETVHLPLLAILSGNEIVPHFLLKKFHCKLTAAKGNPNKKKVFEAVSYLIRGLPFDGNPHRNLTLIRDKIADPRIGEDLMKSGLDWYAGKKDPISPPDKDPGTTPEILAAREKRATSEFSPLLLSVLERNEWRSSNDLEDFRDGDVIPAARVLRLLRKRIYGILLKDREKTSVMEYAVEGTKKKKEYVIEGIVAEAELPPSEHPGLLRLWLEGSDPSVDERKKKLFFQAVDPDLEPEEIAWIPSNLIFPVVALRYLCRGSAAGFFREEGEAEAFLATALKTAEASAEDLERIEPDGPPAPRAVRLSSVFLRCCSTLEVLNESCGFVVPRPDSCPSNYYDGNVFRIVYGRFRSGENYRDILEGDTSRFILFRTLSDLIQNKKS